MAFYISGPKLLFETTEISTHPNLTQQESNYIYLYTTKFETSIKIQLNRKFESTEFETMRDNCIYQTKIQNKHTLISFALYNVKFLHNGRRILLRQLRSVWACRDTLYEILIYHSLKIPTHWSGNFTTHSYIHQMKKFILSIGIYIYLYKGSEKHQPPSAKFKVANPLCQI